MGPNNLTQITEYTRTITFETPADTASLVGTSCLTRSDRFRRSPPTRFCETSSAHYSSVVHPGKKCRKSHGNSRRSGRPAISGQQSL
jgi:hypothetical protein